MGIPIISEIQQFFQWILNFFINKSPRALKILFFLLFLLFFGIIISYFLHIVGVHCNSDKEPVKVSMLDISSNVDILWETDPGRLLKGNTLTICEVHPSKCGSERDCYYFMRQLPSGGWTLCNETNSSSECRYYLNDGSCHNCTYREICVLENQNWFFCGTYYDVCMGDAYFGGSQGTDFLTKCGSTCYVPENYVWNHTTGEYHCLDLDVCGDSAQMAVPAVDSKIEKAGGRLLYEDSEQRSFERIVGISCDTNLNPNLSFFGINIFSYKLWIFIIIIYIMFIFLTKLPIGQNR